MQLVPFCSIKIFNFSSQNFKNFQLNKQKTFVWRLGVAGLCSQSKNCSVGESGYRARLLYSEVSEDYLEITGSSPVRSIWDYFFDQLLRAFIEIIFWNISKFEGILWDIFMRFVVCRNEDFYCKKYDWASIIINSLIW